MPVVFNKVLVIDDDEDIRFLFRMGLGRLSDKKVEEATNVATALIAFDETKPDLVLIDNDLAGESGLDFIRQLPEMRPPIILITARNDDKTIKPYLDMGVIAVLPKPFDPVSLAEKIENLLEKA